MRPNQTALQFHTYLESIESRFDPLLTPERLRHGFYSKLTPQLRMMISNQGEIPNTRMGILSTASRVEFNMREMEKESRKDNKRKRDENTTDKDNRGSKTRNRNFGRNNRNRESESTRSQPGDNSDPTRTRSGRKPKCIGCGKPVWTADCKDPECKKKRREWYQKNKANQDDPEPKN